MRSVACHKLKKHRRMIPLSLKYNNKLISCAKELRNNMTKQEKHLWYDFLSRYPVRFQRQKAIDHYIADFYCHKAKLVVELDGSQHYTEEGLKYDDNRSDVLRRYDLEVIRFSNTDVDRNFVGVCEAIEKKVKQRMEKEDSFRQLR